MKIAGIVVSVFICLSCSRNLSLPVPARQAASVTGSGFYKTVAAYDWRSRDSLAIMQILAGNVPAFLKQFVSIHTHARKDGIQETESAGVDFLSYTGGLAFFKPRF